ILNFSLSAAIRCPPLSTPINGVKTGCSGIASELYNAYCSFACSVGYNLIGASIRRCLENGTWSGETSQCQVISCVPLVPPLFGVISPSSCLFGSNYSQTCRLTCGSPGYVLEGTSARVCGRTGQWTGLNDTRCRDNAPPSFSNTCPKNMVSYTAECSSSALVSWNEPSANDNSGHVSISYPGVRPPVNLSIGLHNVMYSAMDSSGNRVNCSFIVQVTTKSCPVLQPPTNGAIASFSCGSSFGSQASFSCNKGYQITGSRIRSCRSDGAWSGNTTLCNIVKCPAITTPTHGQIFPTQCKFASGVNYGTHCSFMCNVSVGYRLQGPRSVSCRGNGSWSGDTTKIICKDVQPPSIQCPSDMESPTEFGRPYARVTWEVPDPTDNSDEPLRLSGLLPPQVLNVGKKHITYTATDSAGLSKSCTFSIVIRGTNDSKFYNSPFCSRTDLEPPKFSSCPDNIHITSKKKMNKVLLPGVTVTDNVGVFSFTTSRQNGSEFTWGEHNVTYTASDKAGNIAKCHFQVIITDYTCPDLPAPLNGAKACETWLTGMFCTVHCNTGFGFVNQPQSLYVCSPDGTWHNAKVQGKETPSLPDCSKIRRLEWLEAVMDNVQSRTCGLNAETKRKPVGEERQLMASKLLRFPLLCIFALKTPLPSNASLLDLNQTSQQISNNLLEALKKTDLNLNISGVVIEYDTSKPPVFRLTSLVCSKGQVQRGTRCVNCPLGYFFNTTGCQACAVDEYQDQEAQTSCLSCPSGTTTFRQTASKWRKNCREIPSPSSTEEQVIAKEILYSSIALGACVFIGLIGLTIFCVQKHCVAGKTMLREDRRTCPYPVDGYVGCSNPTYVGTEAVQSNDPFAIEISEFQKRSFDNANDNSEEDAEGAPENYVRRLNVNQTEV
ncbi:PREDICTED: sushi, von Willebrand factor type A, EGF and pentraxin domain-containing protein 1-like, partial [Acropora digitifera]|uniref:sushi, von Willebrand factor type A, EGF and pentraxin domain-containing protein 1-like n=1 Tax=Acropora digitifera TaxID=70779 RepID=UPI00077A004E